MSKRLLIGKPSGEDYGLYVSKPGTDVINGSNVLTDRDNLQFDSEVGIGSLNLKNYGQGLLGIPGNSALTSGTTIGASDSVAVITHNLGFIPFVIVQWCLQSDISGGVATKMYTASLDWTSTTAQTTSTSANQLQTKGGVSYAVTSSTLTITNNMVGQVQKFFSMGGSGFQETSRFTQGGVGVGYAYLIFDLQGA
tara:strand:+ start:281 stop:865 length:585 start_codon:yes stop_codon:yes gene_type:complete